MAGQSARIALVALIIAIICHAGAALAAPRPGFPTKKAARKPVYTPLGETVFECGTYSGNQIENKQMEALHAANQRQIQQGAKRLTTGLDYIYDNVWVIEDDGTLTQSGTNLFDQANKTHTYTNNGGGVYTVTSTPFTYDATLGTVVNTGDDGAVLVTLPFAFPYAGTR